MDALESKVPPPVVALLIAFAMWALAQATPALVVPYRAAALIAGVTAIAAVLIELAAAVTMTRAKTTVDPMHPRRACHLVTTGVFRFTRNPIYLADLMLLLAWAIHLASPAAALLAPTFVLYIDRFQIRPEERALARLFGDSYGEYRSRVRRWL